MVDVIEVYRGEREIETRRELRRLRKENPHTRYWMQMNPYKTWRILTKNVGCRE